MNLILDNIIFSLQRAGGISVVWYELLKRILSDLELNPSFIDEPSHNIFRYKLVIPNSMILINTLSKYPILLKRYLNPKLMDGRGIFHSSYYRINNGAEIINVTTVHDFTYEYFRGGITRFIHRNQKGIAISKSKRIICVSQNTKSDLLKIYPKVNPQKIKVIYNGVDSIYSPLAAMNETDINQLTNFSSGEFALFVGDRKGKHKNFKIAVKACQEVHIPLILIGGEALSNVETKFLIEMLGSNRYEHLQGISNNQLNLMYNHAFCLLYPSLYEGFGIPIIEAQRAGCPVISTNYSSIPEIAGKGAILLSEVTEHHLAEMLNLIKDNSKVVANLKEEGYKNAQLYSWDKCYQQTKDLYNEVYQEYFS